MPARPLSRPGRSVTALAVAATLAAGCNGDGETGDLAGLADTIRQVTCDDTPDQPEAGHVLGVGEVVFTASGRAETDAGEPVVVDVVRVEVTDDDGGLALVTYDSVTVSGAGTGWEGWTTAGPGADMFSSPLDDVVSADVVIQPEHVEVAAELAVLDEAGLPTRTTVPVEMTLPCDGSPE